MAKEILIVEDDRPLARSLARLIEAKGYLTRQAHDGHAALSEVSKAKPDLILLDMLIPKKDGHSILADLSASERTSDIPIIAMSGIFRGRNHARDTTRAGAAAFLEKPFPESELVSHVRRLIGSGEDLEAAAGSRFDLEETPAAKLIWELMRDKFSGAIHFEHEKRRKSLLFDEGNPRSIRSNLAKETLGRRLFNSGRIGETTYSQVRLRAKETGQRQGGLLVEMGAITADQLEEAIKEQASQKLLELFSWRKGEAWLQEDVRSITMSTELGHWRPRQVIMQGAYNVHPVVLRELLEPYVELRAEREPSGAGSIGVPAAAALLKDLDEESTVGDVIDDYAPELYALWLIGAVRFTDPETGEVVSVNRADPEDAEETLEAELERRQREQAGQDHFAILGVLREAPVDEVRKAFVLLAKRFHPDKLSDVDAGLRDLAASVFARISQAHEILTNPDSRRKYLKSLQKAGSGGSGMPNLSRIASAETQFKKAEDLVRERDYAGALEALRWAIELDPEEGDFHALTGWATFLGAPDDAEMKEEALLHMKRSTSLAPNSPTGYYYQGQLHKACDEPALAEKMFRKVLEVRPGHVEAGRELRLIEMRRPKSGEKRSRFSFGRKKK